MLSYCAAVVFGTRQLYGPPPSYEQPDANQTIALLVTCGAMSPDLDLCGELVKVDSQPSPEMAGSRPGRIHVKYGNAVTWTLPAMACSTWFVSSP